MTTAIVPISHYQQNEPLCFFKYHYILTEYMSLIDSRSKFEQVVVDDVSIQIHDPDLKPWWCHE